MFLLGHTVVLVFQGLKSPNQLGSGLFGQDNLIYVPSFSGPVRTCKDTAVLLDHLHLFFGRVLSCTDLFLEHDIDGPFWPP